MKFIQFLDNKLLYKNDEYSDSGYGTSPYILELGLCYLKPDQCMEILI
jgi:hypothetical protein